ncbi:MAG: hypothetical protein AAGG01_21425 [Planctomycetota bacterium]
MLTLIAAATPLLAGPLLPSEAHELTRLRSRAPASTVVWLETGALTPLLGQGFDHPLLAGLLENPLVQDELNAKGQDPIAAAAAVEALIGTSPFELAHALASGGIAFGMTDLTPGAESSFLFLRGLDPEAMEDALGEVFETLTNLKILRAPRAEERRSLDPSVRRSYRVRGSDLCIAWLREGTLAIASSWKTLVDCASVKKRSTAIAEARRTAELESLSFAWLDLDGIEDDVDLKDLRDVASDPGAQLVLGPVLSYLGRARTLSLEASLAADRVHVRITGNGVDLGPGTTLFPTESPTQSADEAPFLFTDGLDAQAQLHRDIGAFFRSRTKLFPPRAQPELAEAESNLALLVGGPDALESLLNAILPTISLTASPIDFPENATPDVPLPGLLASIRLDEPERNGARLTSAFQSAVSLTNVEQAMQGRTGRALAQRAVGDTTVTTTSLPAPAAGESVDLRYNLMPACALTGDAFLLGSRPEPVLRAVAASPADEPSSMGTAPITTASPWINVDRISIRGSSVLDLLLRQRDLLVMGGVLEDGLTEARASARADTLLSLTARVVRAEFGSEWMPVASQPDKRATGATLRTEFTLHLAR